jgi:glycosyltransferase involved in cell wall biosynthesis
MKGGIEKRRYVIMKALAKNKKNEMHMFTMFREGMPGMEFMHEGVHYHCIGKATAINKMYKKGKRRSIMFSLRFATLVFNGLRRYKFDIVDTDNMPYLHLFPIYMYCKLSKARFACTWHEVWSRHFWNEYMGAPGSVIGYSVSRAGASLPKYHIANCSTTKQQLEKEFKIKPDRISVLPAAVDADEMRRLNRMKRPKVQDKFIVINRLIRHKRPEIAIRAMKKIDAKLVVVGAGPELEMLRKLVNDEGLERKVTFKQNLSEKELFYELITSKALLMPSQREGLSLATAEALSLGVPVAIVDTTMLPKEIRKYCLEEKEQRFHMLVNKILKNYEYYGKRSLAMRDMAISEFSGDTAEDVYGRIMSG